MNQQELRRKVMSAFEPLRPARSDTYVDCSSVRGDWNILTELGSRIVDSEEYTCQLFSGYKGSSKSAEVNLGFGKLIATLKNNPDRRLEIRRKVNEQTPNLLQALNEFIAQAQANLPADQERGIRH